VTGRYVEYKWLYMSIYQGEKYPQKRKLNIRFMLSTLSRNSYSFCGN
jgi:hypothetical protein